MRERERIHHRRRSKPLCHRRWSSNHQAITIDLQSLLPILISNPRRSERPITKIQSKPKPTSNLRERIGVREREDRNERKRENPPLPPLQTTTPSLLLQTIAAAPNHHTIAVDLQSPCSDMTVVGSDGFSLGFAFAGKTSFFFFFFFWLNSFFFNTTQVYTIKKI